MGETYINSQYIIHFFEGLNNSGVVYALIKNIGNELPDCLIPGKDIDIVVHPEYRSQFHKYMKKIARKVIHPYGKENGWRNIYGLEEFEFWRLHTAVDIYIDVTFSLCCKSVMPKIWVPLDNQIQKSVWENREFDIDHNWWHLDYNSLYLYLIVRCVFDKKTFSDLYQKDIEVLRNKIELDTVKYFFKLVFFKFSDQLINLLDDKLYDTIIPSYLSFKNY